MPLEAEEEGGGGGRIIWSERSAKDERGQVLWMQQLPLCRGKGGRLLRFFFSSPSSPWISVLRQCMEWINQKAN